MSQIKVLVITFASILIALTTYFVFVPSRSSNDRLGSAIDGSNVKNEDRVVTFKISGNKFVADVAGVFDGHGGEAASEFIAKNFETQFRKNLNWSQSDDPIPVLRSALLDTFQDIEEQLEVFLTQLRQFEVGSCGFVVVVVGDRILTANLGDSEAWFFPEIGSPFRLNRVLNANQLEEQERLLNEFPDEDDLFSAFPGSSSYYVKGRLQPTRSFGDLFLKKKIPGFDVGLDIFNPPYISATPVLSRHRGEGHIVLASDGLWDQLTPHHLQYLVKAPGKTPKQKAESLVEAAYKAAADKNGLSLSELRSMPLGKQKRRIVDDISVVVLKVGS